MSYRAIDIARYVLGYCSEQGSPISNLKLQKMLYFLWVDYYKETGAELYPDEICAWQLGPVVPDVYYEFCAHAGNSISMPKPTYTDLGSEREKIEPLIEKYLKLSASALVNRTHQTGTPWSVVYKDGSGLRDVIPFSTIKRLECNG